MANLLSSLDVSKRILLFLGRLPLASSLSLVLLRPRVVEIELEWSILLLLLLLGRVVDEGVRFTGLVWRLRLLLLSIKWLTWHIKVERLSAVIVLEHCLVLLIIKTQQICLLGVLRFFLALFLRFLPLFRLYCH